MSTYYKIILTDAFPAPCASFGGTGPHLQLHLQYAPVGGSFDVFWADAKGDLHGIKRIEVSYSGGPGYHPTQNFVMRGTATAGSPEIADVRVEASFPSRCLWAIAGTSITWTFIEPPNDLDKATWEFNPSGCGPPVRVKVILKRQDYILTTCP